MTRSTEADLNEVLSYLIDEFMAAMEMGKEVSIAELAARHPEFAVQIRSTLETLQDLENLDKSLLSTEAEAKERHPLKTLGDFKLMREIGRGGMGIVYEAVQTTLDRRVAVKILPFAAVADAQRLKRFQNEIRAAGSLHHPHIVPVFTVGVDRGVHFFAMQFIDGPSLDEVIQNLKGNSDSERDITTGSDETDLSYASENRRPVQHRSQHAEPDTVKVQQGELSTQRENSPQTYHRMVAGWGIQAAEALAYAHEYGILHRDIKPGNLLLDSEGQLWIADFGLARIQQDVSVTLSGDLLGTLRYMAPEQAMAKRVLIDHRADVYSLGATLYELLTLQPPFLGADREEATASDGL